MSVVNSKEFPWNPPLSERVNWFFGMQFMLGLCFYLFFMILDARWESFLLLSLCGCFFSLSVMKVAIFVSSRASATLGLKRCSEHMLAFFGCVYLAFYLARPLWDRYGLGDTAFTDILFSFKALGILASLILAGWVLIEYTYGYTVLADMIFIVVTGVHLWGLMHAFMWPDLWASFLVFLAVSFGSWAIFGVMSDCDGLLYVPEHLLPEDRYQDPRF